MQLDSPPMLQHLFLESPWAVMGLCLVIGVALFVAGQRRRQKGLMLAALAMLIPAAGVYLLAQSVTTDREQLIACTRDLVMATAPVDRARIKQLLAPQVVVAGPDGSVWLDQGKVIPKLDSALQRFTLNSQTIRLLDASADGTDWAESVVRVRSDFKGSSAGPVNTDWHLSWQRTPGTGNPSGGGGGWRVVEIRWLRFNGMETPQGMMP